MVNYREILRMTADGSYGIRQIKADAHCSHDTIRATLEAAKAKGISWPLDEDVTNEELQEFLFPGKYASLSIYQIPDFAYIHKELARTGVNLTLLHEEYTNKCLAEGTTPYRYTQFCEKYRRWAKVTKATMRIKHKPGDKTEVDWAGDTLPVYDPVTGDSEPGYLFVGVLPCSFYLQRSGVPLLHRGRNVPDGYSVTYSESNAEGLGLNSTGTLTAYNRKTSTSIQLIKQDQENRQPLAGAIFEIYRLASNQEGAVLLKGENDAPL